MGVPWADCLPGTPGYNNGGGQQSRAAEAKQQADALRSQVQSENAQCASEVQSSDLDIIRQKIELFRESADAPVPFAIASNDTFPTEPERTAIAKWATIRDECNKRADAISNAGVAANPLQATILQQDRAFRQEVTARVGLLIVVLYQAKLTYGEFAQKRYEIDRDGAAAERQFRAATLIAEHDRQLQGQQLAQQQFQNNLIVWSSYMQAVNARQPQTVHIDGSVRVQANCASQRLGDAVTTNCR